MMKTVLKILSLVVIVALGSLMGCKKKDFYLQNEPELSVSENDFSVLKEGGNIIIEVKSTRRWIISALSNEAGWYEISPSELNGENDGRITVFVLPNEGIERSLVLTIATSGGMREQVVIRQLGSFSSRLILYEDFGTEAVGNPLVANFQGYRREGMGATSVRYIAESGIASIRTTAPSSGYPGASGGGNVFMAASGTVFLVKDIDLFTNFGRILLSFGTNQTSDTLLLSYSTDDITWTNIPYSKQEASWGLVNVEFDIPAGSTSLHLKFTGVTSVNGARVDDIRVQGLEDGSGTGSILVVSPLILNVDADGEERPVSIMSNTAWTATSNDTWITVDPNSGNNNQTLKIIVDANPTTSSRLGSVTVKTNDEIRTRTLTVNQAGEAISGGGDGTKENPYSVAQAIAGQDQTPRIVGWVEGYIVGQVKDGVTTVTSANDVFIGVSSGFNSLTNVLIADSPDETDYTKCIAVNLPSGRALRTEVNLVGNPENFRKKLAVNGTLRNYFGLAGLRDSDGTSDDFVLDGEEETPPVGIIFEESLLTLASFNKFTIQNVLGAQVWSFDSRYGAVMSGFASGSHANEDWFISPAINLSEKSNVVLTFEHARGPAGSMSVSTSNYTLWVSTDYTSGNPSTATWTQLTIPTHGTVAWTYVSSGDITIPTDKLSPNTRFAFKYVSNTTESATWQIRNVVVK
jgi:hypothetical protein